MGLMPFVGCQNSTPAAQERGNTFKWHGRQGVTEYRVTHLTAFQHPQMSQSNPAADRKAGQTHTFKAPSTYTSRAATCPMLELKQVSRKPNQPCTGGGHILVSRNHPMKHFLLPTSPSQHPRSQPAEFCYNQASQLHSKSSR